MKGNKVIMVLLSIVSVVSACSSKVPPAAYLKYFDDTNNQLVKQQVLGELKYEVRLHDGTYLAIKEQNPAKMNKQELLKARDVKKDYYEFAIRLSAEKSRGLPLFKTIVNTEDDYNALCASFTNGMHNFYLTSGSTDTITPIYYFFNAQNTILPYEEILIGYSIPNITKLPSLTLGFDGQVFGHGPIKFNFNTKAIHNKPQLTL